MPRRSMSLSLLCWCLVVVALLLLAGCRQPQADLPGAASEPAAAIAQRARLLHDDDLVGYARASVPPEQFERLEQAWRDGDSRWPLTELPLDDKLVPLLAALSANDAERTLQRAFNAQLAGQAAAVRQAAHSLGLFGIQYLGSQGDYSPAQRAHYVQLVKALSDWATAAPLSDRKLASAAIAQLTRAARTAGIASDEAMREAGMVGALERLAPLNREFRTVLASYGLSLDETLAGLRTGLVSERGDTATVRVQYAVAGTPVDVELPLRRVDGRWYLADMLDEVQAVLVAADQARAARQPPVEEAAADTPDRDAQDRDKPAKP